MTHIPGTGKLETNPNIEKDKVNSSETKILGVYKKETEVQKKLASKSSEWYLNIKYWIRFTIGFSLVCVVLGFLIYKSFFILALFSPIIVLGTWYIVQMVERTITKLDYLSK
jgi:hypothetical protein